MNAKELHRRVRCIVRGCRRTKAPGSPFCPEHLRLMPLYKAALEAGAEKRPTGGFFGPMEVMQPIIDLCKKYGTHKEPTQ